jgi:hypothetical protein
MIILFGVYSMSSQTNPQRSSKLILNICKCSRSVLDARIHYMQGPYPLIVLTGLILTIHIPDRRMFIVLTSMSDSPLTRFKKNVPQVSNHLNKPNTIRLLSKRPYRNTVLNPINKKNLLLVAHLLWHGEVYKLTI